MTEQEGIPCEIWQEAIRCLWDVPSARKWWLMTSGYIRVRSSGLTESAAKQNHALCNALEEYADASRARETTERVLEYLQLLKEGIIATPDFEGACYIRDLQTKIREGKDLSCNEARHVFDETQLGCYHMPKIDAQVREDIPRHDLGMLQDLFGNPFRPPAFPKDMMNSNVVAMADAIYGKRRFEDMPILADAREEAGWEHEEVLAHCRSNKRHFRGCWVLDLALGKM